MLAGRPTMPHFVAIASVILSAQVFAADPSLATLEPRLTELARAARGEIGVSLFSVETAIALERMGVAEPPPQSEWMLDVQRELIKRVPPLDLVAARARYTAELRDTATPDDMAGFLLKLQRGELLPRPHTDFLLDLLARVKTGPRRLKDRLPSDTIVAHKTGTTAVVIDAWASLPSPTMAGTLRWRCS